MGGLSFRRRPASRRQRSDLVTLAHIKEQSRLSLGSYGRPRMSEELNETGLDVGYRRVGRLMRQNGISVVRTRKHKVTTDSNHKFNIAPTGPTLSAHFGIHSHCSNCTRDTQ
jgi:transposase InsO family protein